MAFGKISLCQYTCQFMQKILLPSDVAIKSLNWYSNEFIYNSVATFLKENGYKVHKNNFRKGTNKAGTVIIASKFLKKEVIEVKGFSDYYSVISETVAAKDTSAKSWFTEALFNSIVNFSLCDTADIAMALPNAGRYREIIQRLNDYFSINDLYFKIYLVNEDGSIEVSNLNSKYAPSTYKEL